MQEVNALDHLPIAELGQRFQVKNDGSPAKTSQQADSLKKIAFSQSAMRKLPDLASGKASAQQIASLVRVPGPDVQINHITLCRRYHLLKIRF
jgi:hypothetical protein